MTKRRVIALTLAVHLTGCATIAHRSGEAIDVRSDPAGADAVIECANGLRVSSVTPTRLVIPRKANGCVLSLGAPGVTPQMIQLRRRVSGKFWSEFWIGVPAAAIASSAGDGGLEEIGTVVVFGSIAVVALGAALVDLASQRFWAHEPDVVDVKLEPAP